MRGLANVPGIDPQDGNALRIYFESMRSQLATDRSSWDPQWQQLGAFFAPRSTIWDYSQVNNGQRKDYNIINETGLLALRTLQAGMLNGMSPQTRPWVRLQSTDPMANQQQDAKDWFQDTEQRMLEVFLKSNTYQSLLTLYGEEGLYGTSVFLVVEDEKTVIRCHPYPMGSYYLMCDDALRIDGCIRVMNMTVRQIVERYGYEQCSSNVQVMWDSPSGGNKETRYPVVYAITKGSYFGPKGYKPEFPWIAVTYELGSFNEKRGILRRSGFMENPLIAGRWKVTGENVYGESAGMDCLGSVMSLQAWEERTAQATEKQFNPPMIASSDLDPRRLTTLPGDISFADSKDVSNLFKPAYQVDFRIDGALTQIQRIEARINDAMYRALFQMFSETDRRQITATEINARMQEKMQVLGPVVERNVEEVLSPLCQRTLSIMQRQGRLRQMPDSLRGKAIKFEFISILAEAQKLGQINNISTLMNFVGSEAGIAQGVIDVIDTDEVTRDFADFLHVPAKMVRTPEQVAKIRQDKAFAQQQAVAAENAQKLAGAAKNLSEARTGTGSLLDQATGALGGG